MNTRANILFVDDEKKFAEAMAKVLRYGGYSVQTAYSGSRALEKYQTEKFDLVITDLKMPVMDGIELMRHIRDINEDQRILVITAFPGQCMPWNRRFTESGGEEFDLEKVDYLVKPFTPKTLIGAVEKIFRNERLDPEDRTDETEDIEKILKEGIEGRQREKRRDSTKIEKKEPESKTEDFIPTAARQILEETSQALGAPCVCALVKLDGTPMAVVNDSGASQDSYSGKFSTALANLRNSLVEIGIGNMLEGILKLDNQWILVDYLETGNCYICILTGLEVPMGTLRTVAKKTTEGLKSLLAV